MKKIVLVIAMFFAFSVVTYGQKSTEPVKGAKITFENTVYDYGEITKNSNGDCIFTFQNTGTEPLLLTSVSASCGCTQPNWTKNPIMPGKTGSIKVTYKTSRIGPISQSVTVNSNSVDNSREVLRIKGSVKEIDKN